jgi:hypothetical protein
VTFKQVVLMLFIRRCILATGQHQILFMKIVVVAYRQLNLMLLSFHRLLLELNLCGSLMDIMLIHYNHVMHGVKNSNIVNSSHSRLVTILVILYCKNHVLSITIMLKILIVKPERTCMPRKVTSRSQTRILDIVLIIKLGIKILGRHPTVKNLLLLKHVWHSKTIIF